MNIRDFEFNINLPELDLESKKSVYDMLNGWTKLVKHEELRKKQELRLKKINEINAKYK